MLVAVLVLAWQLLVPPVVGLANNGDFHKVIGAFNLAAPNEEDYKFAPITYVFNPGPPLVLTFSSVEQLLALAAIGVNTLFSKTGTFDIRFIGLVHGSLYLLSLFLVLRLLRELGRVRRLICSALLILIFGDVLYVAALNSFYMDTAAIVFLLLSVAFLCRLLKWGRRWDVIGFVLSAICFAASKAQHAPLGVLIALMITSKPSTFMSGLGIRFRAGIVAALIATVLWTLNATPWDYRATPLFSQVFFGILPRSDDPGRSLRQLGLNESYKRYIGTYAYSQGSPLSDPAFTREFLSKVSYARLALYFLRHPSVTYSIVAAAMGEAGRQRPYMGNFDRTTGVPPFTESRAFSIWSDLKTTLFKDRGDLYIFYTVVLATALPLLLFFRRNEFPPGAAYAGLTLALLMMAEIAISALGDGLDFVRHFSVFTALSDAVLVALLISVLHPRR